jgi:hypothetical protein
MSHPVPPAFAAADLPAPWVPETLAAQVRPVGDSLYGTRADLLGVHNLYPLAEEAAAQTVEDYVLYGSSGRGMQSNTAVYLLVHGPLALLLEQALGNVYGDDDAAQSVRHAWALADDLRAEIARHTWAPGARLLVLASDLTGTQWALLPQPMPPADLRAFDGWQQAPGSLATLEPVIDWLVARRDGA